MVVQELTIIDHGLIVISILIDGINCIKCVNMNINYWLIDKIKKYCKESESKSDSSQWFDESHESCRLDFATSGFKFSNVLQAFTLFAITVSFNT